MKSISPYQLPLFPTSKRCSQCAQTKPLEAFGKDKHTRDGLTQACRECRNARGRAFRLTPQWRAWLRRYRSANQDRIRAWTKQWLAAHPGLATSYTRRSRQRHPERTRARLARYAEANREKRHAWDKAFRTRHPERVAVKLRNLHAKRAAAPGRHTVADLDDIFAVQAGLCASCAVALITPIHVDHKIPLSRGGSNGLENLALTCRTCNLRKGTKTDAEYRAWLAARPADQLA